MFIAHESGRAVHTDRMPDDTAVSVVTIAELHLGVLAAPDIDTRARRLTTLDALSDFEVLPIDEEVATAWARLRVHVGEAGRRVNVNDLWIAATALVHGLPVVTQDADFDPVEGLGGLTVVRV